MTAYYMNQGEREKNYRLSQVAAAGHVPGIIEVADDPAGVAGSESSGRDVLDHHAARTDHAAIADGHAGIDYHRTANPHIRPDFDRFAKFQPGPALKVIHGVGGGVDLHVGSEHGAAADLHSSDIQDHAVEIHENALAKKNIGAVIAVKGRLDARFLTECAEQFLQQLFSEISLIGRAVVESPGKTPRVPAVGH